MTCNLSRRAMLLSVISAATAIVLPRQRKPQLGISIRFIKNWHPVESVYYQWSQSILLDRVTDRIKLRGDALRRFMQYPGASQVNPDTHEIVGYLTHSPFATGWAFGRSWFCEPLPKRMQG